MEGCDHMNEGSAAG